jgi:predicted NBD/HSP70 family sugar kinase
MVVLVIDIGGSHVKLATAGEGGQVQKSEFESGPDLTPAKLVAETRRRTGGWKFDVISLGYPGLVHSTRPDADPGNLGGGWVGFDFEKAFGCPVRVVNDAALQALGGYAGGRMLFLGVGTGLGSALIAERVIVPLELGCLRHRTGQTLAERLGKKGLEAVGEETWKRELAEAISMLREAFAADYVLVGGGNAGRLDPLPPNCRRGGNDDAIRGGELLWQEFIEPHDRKPSRNWRVV